MGFILSIVVSLLIKFPCQTQTEENTNLAKLNDSTNEITTHTSNSSLLNMSFSTCTATDALASEAAFMENIGLYLTPKPLLQNPRPSMVTGQLVPSKSHATLVSDERASIIVDNQVSLVNNAYQGTSQWEDDLVLEWSYTDHNEVLNSSNDNQEQQKENTSATEPKGLARSQPSLLSYLHNKNKATYVSNNHSNETPTITDETDEHTTETVNATSGSDMFDETSNIKMPNELPSPTAVSNISVGNTGCVNDVYSREPKKPDPTVENFTNQFHKENQALNIPSQLEFMKQIDLFSSSNRLNLIETEVSLMLPVTPSKLKLWNPEKESSPGTNFHTQNHEEIWKDVLENTAVETGISFDIYISINKYYINV